MARLSTCEIKMLMSGNSQVTHADPVAVAESFFSGIFIRIFNEEAARKHFGFHQISPFYSNEGMPGWYLWFEKIQGVYGIFVIDAQCPSIADKFDGKQTNSCIRLALTYYPGTEEDVLETFSWHEQIVRMSELFDGSGTPTPEASQQFPAGFFTIGHMDLFISVSGDIKAVVSRAPDLWVDVHSDGMDFIGPEGQPIQLLQPGEKNRAVPGWLLTRFLTDKIISCLCCCKKISPWLVNLFSYAAPEFVFSADNRVVQNFSLGIVGYGLEVIFEPTEAACCKFGKTREQINMDKWLASQEHRNGGQLLFACREKEINFIEKGFSDWWAIKNLDFHDHGGHLCACFNDH